MKVSTTEETRALYDATASSYAQMMAAEIELQLYAEKLGRLAKQIEHLEGMVLDTSCGSGHMLRRLRDLDQGSHDYLGVDLSAQMLAEARLVTGGELDLKLGDMRALPFVTDEAAAAVISFFALHHLDAEDCLTALREWHRVLKPGGRLLLGTWEGEGPIDYGEHADLIARKYSQEEMLTLTSTAGFVHDRVTTEPVEGLGMDAVYVEARREA